jgi:hypothetical protein
MNPWSGCSRRAVIGAAAGIAILDGCMQQGSSLRTAKSSSCSGGTCIDLSDTANAALANPGGAMLVDILRRHRDGDPRLGDAGGRAVGDLHARRLFDGRLQRLTCPCHGSEFDEAGAVRHASRSRVYPATLANQTITIA